MGRLGYRGALGQDTWLTLPTGYHNEVPSRKGQRTSQHACIGLVFWKECAIDVPIVTADLIVFPVTISCANKRVESFSTNCCFCCTFVSFCGSWLSITSVELLFPA